MSLGEALTALGADSLQWGVIVTVIGLGLLDLVIGIARSVADPGTTFDLGLVDVWVRKQLAGRIVPIVLVLIFSALAPDVTIGEFKVDILAVAGNAAAAVYAASTAKSIVDSLNPRTTDTPPTPE